MPTMISKTLNTAVKFCIPNLVFESNDVSTQPLRAVGAMALLFFRVDSDIIELIGHYCSNEM